MSNKPMVISIIMFLVLFIGMIIYMPDDFINDDITQPDIVIPDYFSAWMTLPRDISIEHTIEKESLSVKYDFTSYVNQTLWFKVDWIATLHFREFGYYILSYPFTREMNPTNVDLNYLLANWNPNYNASFFSVYSEKFRLECLVEDYNGTRNNISSAWDDGYLNVTLAIPSGQSYSESITAREMVFALLTFRLPSVLSSVSPLMGFMLSCCVYVPTAIVFYIVFVELVRGGGT